MSESGGRDRVKRNILLLSDSLELDSFIGVLPSTSGAATVKVLLNVMPAEAANLVKKSDASFRRLCNDSYLVTADTWLEIKV